MFLIYGWGFVTTKILSLLGTFECFHCHRIAQWPHQRMRTWITLFFIPCIPYKTRYWVGCPHCKYGYEVDENGKRCEQVNVATVSTALELRELQGANEPHGPRR
jgi:hypothetical protein